MYFVEENYTMIKPTASDYSVTERQEHVLEMIIGYVLLGGVVLSVLLVILGLIWNWHNTGMVGVDYTKDPPPSANLFTFALNELRDIAACKFNPRLLISLGVTVLLLTPYVRVLTSLVFFALAERNGKYTLFTGFVLAVLTYSLFLR